MNSYEGFTVGINLFIGVGYSLKAVEKVCAKNSFTAENCGHRFRHGKIKRSTDTFYSSFFN